MYRKDLNGFMNHVKEVSGREQERAIEWIHRAMVFTQKLKFVINNAVVSIEISDRDRVTVCLPSSNAHFSRPNA